MARRDKAQLDEHVDVESATESLIRHGRIEKPVAQNELPGAERRSDDVVHELRP